MTTDELHVYDTKAPLTGAPMELPYGRAVDWICEGMAPLGEEYVRVSRAGLTSEVLLGRQNLAFFAALSVAAVLLVLLILSGYWIWLYPRSRV